MIDYFHISIQGQFEPIGKIVSVVHPESGHTSSSFTKTTVRADKCAPLFHIQNKVREKRLDIWGCPLMWLQGHNGFGSNDLQFLVAESVALVFARLHRAVPDAVVEAVRTRSYKVREVHIAELHAMKHSLVAGYCDEIRRCAPAELQAVPLERGVGIRLWPNSRDRRVLIYDKREYFRDRSLKHKVRFLGQHKPGSMEWLGECLLYERMLEQLERGVRIETRHMRALKRRGLDIGSAWTPDIAKQLHLELLQSVPLMDLVCSPSVLGLYLQFDAVDRCRLAIWSGGFELKDYFDSESSYYRWCSKILKRTGWDVSKTQVPCDRVEWNRLISERSILPTPKWAVEGNFVARKRKGFVSASQLAWPIVKSADSK